MLRRIAEHRVCLGARQEPGERSKTAKPAELERHMSAGKGARTPPQAAPACNPAFTLHRRTKTPEDFRRDALVLGQFYDLISP